MNSATKASLFDLSDKKPRYIATYNTEHSSNSINHCRMKPRPRSTLFYHNKSLKNLSHSSPASAVKAVSLDMGHGRRLLSHWDFNPIPALHMYPGTVSRPFS